MMLGFEGMIGTYEQRNVANFKNDVFEIDTSLVTDRAIPYETAVAHKNFRNGNWIVLGWRETKEEAQKFHDEMVKYFCEHEKEITSIKDVWENIEYERKDD